MLVAPIAVGREQFIKLIDDSVVGGNRIIGMVTQRDPSTETPGAGDIYPMGVAVAIRMMGKGQDATRLIVQGLQRFQILQVTSTEPYMTAKVKLLEDENVADDSVEIEALKRQLSGLFTKIVDLSQDMPDELKNITGIDQPSVATDLMAAHVGRLSTADKIEVLETLNVKERMSKLLAFLTREAQVLELGASLQNQVAGEMGKAQRDYYLREQLKAIQKELGEGDERGQEIEELKKKVEESGMPEEARKEADRELDRLQRMSPGAPEVYRLPHIHRPYGEPAVDQVERGQPGHRRSEACSGRGPSRIGEGQGSHPGVPVGPQVQEGRHGASADPVFVGPSGSR
jgi:ATP-dependent Lon protease